MNIEVIDLRSICRDCDLMETKVSIMPKYGMRPSPWLLLGSASILKEDNRELWWLRAHMGQESIGRAPPTDFEHDTVYACKLPLIGVQLSAVYQSMTRVNAWIDPDAFVRFDPELSIASDAREADFHVPRQGYDPRKHPEAHECNLAECTADGGPHTIVPEDFFVPPYDPELYAKVRGLRVEVTFHYPGAGQL